MEEQDKNLENPTLETEQDDLSLDDAALAAEAEQGTDNNSDDKNKLPEDVEGLKKMLEKKQKTISQLYKRMKTAEAKTVPPKPATNPGQGEPVTKSKDFYTKEESQFLMAGHDDEELEVINMLMEKRKLSFADAQKDKIYLALVDRKKAEERAQKAALGASSGQKSKNQSTFKAGMTEAQHREAWNKQRE